MLLHTAVEQLDRTEMMADAVAGRPAPDLDEAARPPATRAAQGRLEAHYEVLPTENVASAGAAGASSDARRNDCALGAPR